MLENKIELISPNYIDQYRSLSSSLYAMNRDLALSSGWHYLLDWTWALSQIGAVDGKVILDAGAGIGLMQWFLASKGGHIISVDRSDRTCIPYHLISNFNVDGLSPSDKPMGVSEILNVFNRKAALSKRVKSLSRGLLGSLSYHNHAPVTGSVNLYRKDLSVLTDIPDNSIDTIVSISALEHNGGIDVVKNIVSELLRVLRPGGKMIITLPASRDKDWFFEPAYSWCFTDITIRELFRIEKTTPSNFDQYDKIFGELINSTELKNNLSWHYYFSRKNGMPLGKWNPQYLPVGVVKTK